LRNNELLALQAEVGAAVHADWIGREVDVLVERKTNYHRRTAAPRSSADGRISLGAGLTAGRTPGSQPESEPVQVSGRTQGDLITVFDVADDGTADAMIGGIVRVKVDGSGPLLLRGSLLGAAVPAVNDR
jgi:tRNA A37 methylthiotransferase MiaB